MNHMMMEEAAKQMPRMMGAGMSHPLAQGAMMAASGYAVGRSLLGATLLRNPLVLLAAGVAAGYLVFKYEKEIVLALSKASGMGKDFVMHQKENLSDLLAEAKETEAKEAQPTAEPPAAPAP